jgi:cytochrome c nitrite reductase small subunit
MHVPAAQTGFRFRARAKRAQLSQVVAMPTSSSVKRKRWLLLLSAIGALAILFVMLGPPKVLARSETPDFCGGCHTMESQYEAWFHNGAHRRKLCVDCHLPNDNVALHYIWKSIDGMKDVAFQYSGRYEDDIKLSAHGTDVVQANCIRCHGAAVEMIDTSRKCWDCHRRLIHKRGGPMQTG